MISHMNLNAKTLITKYSRKTHPLEQTSFIGKLFINWITPFIHLGNKTIFTQSLHPNLPQVDSLEYNTKLINNYIEQEKEKVLIKNSQKVMTPSQDSYNRISEEAGNPSDNIDQIGCVLKLFRGNFIKHIVLLILTKLVEILVIAIIWFCVGEARYYKDERNYQGLPENYQFFIYVFLALILAQLAASMISSYNSVDISRTSLRLQTCAVSIIYQKIFKINPNLAKFVENDTDIINHIQVDANKMQDLPQISVYLTGCIIECITGMSIGAYVFGWPFLIFLADIILFGIFGSVLYKMYLGNLGELHEKKTMTQSLLRNCLKNLEFIKTRVWENYIYRRIMKRRSKEIETLTYNTVVYLVWIFVIWICPIIGFILMMICVGYNGTTDYFTVENTVLFLKVYFLIMEAMFAIPSCVEYLLDIRNSMNKIRDFLDTNDELIVSKRQRRRNKKRFMSKDSVSNRDVCFSTELHMRDGGRDSYDLNESNALQQATMKENIEDSVNQVGNFTFFSP